MERIIKACVQGGVYELSVDGISLKFGQKTEIRAEPPKVDVQLPPGMASKSLPETDHTKEAKESLEVDELRAKEEQIAMLILEDPAEFERQLAAGELEEMIEDESADDE